MQHCATAMAANTSDLAAAACFHRAQEASRTRRLQENNARIVLIRSLIHMGAYSAAQDQLKALTSDERRATSKYGPLDETAAGIRDATRELADRRQHQWPANLPEFAGIHDWFPGVVSVFGRVLAFCLLGAILYWVLLQIRNAYRRLYWRTFANPEYVIRWSVSSIADETKQSAAGALIDSLNVDYNPLFQKLYTSSFLAAPPALLPPGAPGDPSTFVFRNLFIDLLGLPSDLVRKHLSPLIEDLYIPTFARHRFTQVKAYEDINLKLGAVEASLGAIANTIRSWWMRGWPSVTGSVLFETVNEQQFASIRLIANFGTSGGGLVNALFPDRVPEQMDEEEMVLDESPEALRQFFSQDQDRTLSVFASTQADEAADAVALASQRAAFRLLYRLARRPADPGLAVAASSFRQGVRLLNTVL
jgi:hypothetical protein